MNSPLLIQLLQPAQSSFFSRVPATGLNWNPPSRLCAHHHAAGKGFALFEALDIFAEESGAEEGDDAAIEEEETDDGFGPPAEVVGDSEL